MKYVEHVTPLDPSGIPLLWMYRRIGSVFVFVESCIQRGTSKVPPYYIINKRIVHVESWASWLARIGSAVIGRIA
jgi:hypothetical protein